MPYPNLDALFYMSSKGDVEAFLLLHEEFTNKASFIIKQATTSIPKYAEIRMDFAVIIEESFSKINNEYDASKGSYTWYMKTYFHYKILDIIKYATMSLDYEVESLDDVDANGRLYFDSIEDKGEVSLTTQIAVNNFKYRLSSPGGNQSRKDVFKRRVLLMRYGGFSDREICKKLNLTPGVFRGLCKTLDEDEDLNNFKLDLK